MKQNIFRKALKAKNGTKLSGIHRRRLSNTNLIPCQRDLFDIPHNVCWFNCSYLSPGLKSQINGASKGMERKLHPWNVSPDDFFSDIEEFRLLMAKLLHKTCNDISLISSVSFGTAVVAKHLDKKIDALFKNGNKQLNIVMLRDQFPSNYYVWKELSNQYGSDRLEIRIVDRENQFTSWTKSVLTAIDDNTVLVTVPNVHWTDGSLIDIEQISNYIIDNHLRPKCHFLLDVTQSLGAMPFPKNIEVDYVVGALYKWLIGPYGCGFMYVAPQHQHNDPLEYGWLNRSNARNFSELANYVNDYQIGARRFDMGRSAQLQLLPIVLPALRQIVHEWTVPRIYETLSYHNGNLADKMEEIGLNVAYKNERGGHIIGIKFDENKLSGAEILEHMRKENIFVSIRGGSIRISPHLFFTTEEYEKFVEVMQSIVKYL